MSNQYHIPVLLNQSIDALNINPNGTYVDVTFGGGGHSRAILSKLDKGRIFAFDQDADAIKNVPNDERLIFVRSNFRFMQNFLRLNRVSKVDGIIADLGVSSHHFDDQERGFSFRFTDAGLDMRMNREGGRTAAHVLNTYDEADLRRIFAVYGEVDRPAKLVSIIADARKNEDIVSVQEFIDIIAPVTPKFEAKHYLAKVFQALRIEVNGEMKVLYHFLQQTPKVLSTGGRLVVISYHSLEDRPVKNFMRSGNIEGKIQKDFYGQPICPFKLITKKAIVPDESEIEQNGRARSAKLRVAEKV